MAYFGAAITDVLILSLGLSLLLAIIYRVFTKPEEMRRLKGEMKEIRAKMKEAQKAGNQQETNRLLTESMKLNQQQFKGNMKPLMASLLIFILALNIMGGLYGPHVPVAVTYQDVPGLGTVPAGTLTIGDVAYDVVITDDNHSVIVDLNRDGTFDEDSFGREAVIFQEGENYWKFLGPDQGAFPFVPAQQNTFLFTPDILELPFTLPLPAWDFVGFPFFKMSTHIGWFWFYLLITIPTTFLFRKLLGVE